MPETTRSPQFFEIPAGSEPTSCKSCEQTIYFAVTAKGHRMPVSVAHAEAKLPTQREPGSGISHFVDCPTATQHRRRR